jgi:hypothetical protein
VGVSMNTLFIGIALTCIIILLGIYLTWIFSGENFILFSLFSEYPYNVYPSASTVWRVKLTIRFLLLFFLFLFLNSYLIEINYIKNTIAKLEKCKTHPGHLSSPDCQEGIKNLKAKIKFFKGKGNSNLETTLQDILPIPELRVDIIKSKQNAINTVDKLLDKNTFNDETYITYKIAQKANQDSYELIKFEELKKLLGDFHSILKNFPDVITKTDTFANNIWWKIYTSCIRRTEEEEEEEEEEIDAYLFDNLLTTLENNENFLVFPYKPTMGDKTFATEECNIKLNLWTSLCPREDSPPSLYIIAWSEIIGNTISICTLYPSLLAYFLGCVKKAEDIAEINNAIRNCRGNQKIGNYDIICSGNGGIYCMRYQR